MGGVYHAFDCGQLRCKLSLCLENHPVPGNIVIHPDMLDHCSNESWHNAQSCCNGYNTYHLCAR